MLQGTAEMTAASAEMLLVLTTCSDAQAAARLADSIIAERLAACVSAIDGVASTYRWNGALEHATETLLVIKTTPDRYADLEEHIRARCGYELPEIVAVRPEGGYAAYLDWVSRETGSRR
jgi:periplasmic divalent cation tolerance protein